MTSISERVVFGIIAIGLIALGIGSIYASDLTEQSLPEGWREKTGVGPAIVTDSVSSSWDESELLSLTQLELTGTALWSLTYDLVFEDGFAYFGMRYGLRILDTRTPPFITIAHQEYLPGRVSCLEKHGNSLFVSVRDEGLRIYDVQNPYEPSLLTSIEDGYGPHAMLSHGNRLYAVSHDSLHIWDITHPEAPVQLGALDYYRFPWILNMCFHEGIIYAAGGLYVSIVDVSDPANPFLRGNILTWNTASDVGVLDSVLYVASNTYVDPPYKSSLLAFKIPEVDTVYELLFNHEFWGELYALSLSADFMFLSGGDNGAAVMDITDPLDPQPVWCMPYLGSAVEFEVDGNLGLISQEIPIVPVFGNYRSEICRSYDSVGFLWDVPIDTGDMILADLSDPTDPIVLSTYTNPGRPARLMATSDYVFVGSSTGRLSILDNTKSFNLPVLASFEPRGSIGNFDVQGNILYVCGSEGLEIYDISDIVQPKLLGFLPTPSAGSVIVRDTLAFLAAGVYSLGIISIADPANPYLIKQLLTPDFSTELVIRGDYVFIADRAAGLQVADISDPQNPELVATYSGEDGQLWATNVTLHDKWLFVGSASYVAILDISYPLLPTKIGELDGDYDFKVYHDLFVSVGWDRVIVTDISSPSLPVVVASYQSRGIGSATFVDGNHIYSADYRGVLRFRTPVMTSVGEDETAEISLPMDIRLHQNYPNPFNPSTTIEFELAKGQQVMLEVFNVLGQKVETLANRFFPAGLHKVTWDAVTDDGQPIPSGVYLYRLQVGEETVAKKMLLVK